MKKAFLFSAMAFALISCKKEKLRSMTVVKDCTGVYLRVDGKDYHVCNDGLLEKYSSGASVMATVKTISDCPEQSDRIVCMMFHENEGWVEIVSLR
jgi:hypothetical protein